MLFRRRHKKTFWVSLRDILWPSTGWRRAALYFKHRLGRLPGTSHALAAGFACGAAVSFTPFVGLHFVLAALLAWVMRANILTSALGTIVGNPWTFPLIWVISFKFGSFLLGVTPDEAGEGQVTEVMSALTFNDLIERPGEVILPFFDTVFVPVMLGGAVIGFISWGIIYYPLRKLIREYKRKRLEKLMAKYPPRLEKHFADAMEYEKISLPQMSQGLEQNDTSQKE
ncbi:MAG: hypothetical protein CMF31_08605 [Kordiimonas sp.]|nr:hypothetical protein [Kordiimonas sp.]|tara:strand:+ start:288 stop:968 length:681 start_codon:yes stop_codon:yes gene_type:complete